MTLVAEFTIPPEALPLGVLLTDRPETEIEVERIIPADETALPFFWAWGVEPECVLEYAEREPAFAAVHQLEEVRAGALYRAEWSPHADVVQGIQGLDGTIIESVGTSEQWRFEIRAQDRDSFIQFQEVFEAHGISVTLTGLSDLADRIEADGRDLTPIQRETLMTAYREGYFEQPRETTQEELSEQFGISSRAVSDRFRRGIRNLIAETLLPSERR